MRSISTELKDHLAEECTTLTTCCKMTRRDGVQYFFTEHDQDLTVSGDLYVSSKGYSKTAIKSSAGFATDNLDISGFFDDNSLAERDVRNGLLDFAEVLLFLVNYQDIGMGTLILRRGYLGEVYTSPSGRFNAELRGLIQPLSQTIGYKFQPECRRDVGDSKCKFPINPPEVQRSTLYQEGDYVKVATGTGTNLVYGVPLLNGSFESGDLSSWTVDEGDPAVVSTFLSMGPYSGTYYLHGANPSSSFGVSQIVDMSSSIDFDPAAVDASQVTLQGSVQRATSGATVNDLGRFRVEALSATNVVLSTLWDTGLDTTSVSAVWEPRSTSGLVLPSGTRKLRVRCDAEIVSGSVTNTAFDDILLQLVDSNGVTLSQELYENRIYEVIQSGTTDASEPTYDETIGNTTTDGTAILRAHSAFSRHAVVSSVTSDKEFQITVSEDRAVDDWFNQGSVLWESGQNTGIPMEVKGWDRTGGDVVTLYLPMNNTVNIGDRLIIHPGCDGHLQTCTDKFRIPDSQDFELGNFLNMRAEPYLPGRDALGRYPDAK